MRGVWLVLLAVGCAGAAPSPRGPATGDAPYELGDDIDLAESVDALWSLPVAERGPARAPLAAAILERAAVQLRSGRYHLASAGLLDAAELWQGDSEKMAEGLAPHRKLLDEMARAFRRAGTDGEVLTAQVLRDLAYGSDGPSPEMAEIFTFLDYLGTVERGRSGQYARELAAAAPLVSRAAPRWLVDRYVEVQTRRQEMVNTLLTADGASFELVSAHTDVLVTAQAIAQALALAGRSEDIAVALAGIKGIGADRDLTKAALAVTAVGDEPSWLALAGAMRDVRAREIEAASAHAVCVTALARFPDSAPLHAAAGGYASSRGRVQAALAHLRAAQVLDRGLPGERAVVDQLTAVYRERARQLAFGGRDQALRRLLGEIDRFYDEIGTRFGKVSWSASRASILTAVGRGKLGQGDLAEAKQLFERSLALAPTLEAYESLGTMAAKRDRPRDALGFYVRGLARPTQGLRDHWDRARVLRLAGEAALAADEPPRATQHLRDALAAWNELEKNLELTPGQDGERLVEIGRIHAGLGEFDRAIESFEAAVDADPHGGETHIQVVASLLGAGHATAALDAFHRGLGSERISDYYKVYMSLWIVADARRRQVHPDPLAIDFLRQQQGALWHQRLAAWATNRQTIVELERFATSASRRAELAFYRAVLTPQLAPQRVRAYLDEVIASNLILHFEYDLAKRWRN